MTTDQKGAIAEAAIALAAMKLGVDAYRPLGEGGRCDLILDVGPRLLRVQLQVGGFGRRSPHRALLHVPKDAYWLEEDHVLRR